MTGSGDGVVVVVTGGSSAVGQEVARALACEGDAIALVYLERQRAAEAVVDEMLAAGATAVAVRAGLGDELDVGRVFVETAAVFITIDLVVHTTPDDPSVLFEIAARSLRPGCGIVSVVEPRSPALVDRLRAHEIALLIAGSDPTVADLLALVRQWRAGSPLSPSRT